MRPGELKILLSILGVFLLAAVYAFMDWLFESRRITPGQLLLVMAPFVILYMFFLHRSRRPVDLALEAAAREFGWHSGPRGKKKAFTVLPEEKIVREWQGRRVGLTLLEPNPKSGFLGLLRFSVDVPAEGDLEVWVFIDRLTSQGRWPAFESARGERYRAQLSDLLTNHGDRLSLKSGRLTVDLVLTERVLSSGSSQITIVPAYDPFRPDIPSLELLLRQSWLRIAFVLPAFSSP
ncbi:MAG TPA: hypothetical protein VJ725_05245 [Thermoanaerobaculia bacterium]|nr:hypothetical protein [Thermoanaerobaculia bacterium]